jgi:hypothetical protein
MVYSIQNSIIKRSLVGIVTTSWVGQLRNRVGFLEGTTKLLLSTESGTGQGPTLPLTHQGRVLFPTYSGR